MGNNTREKSGYPQYNWNNSRRLHDQRVIPIYEFSMLPRKKSGETRRDRCWREAIPDKNTVCGAISVELNDPGFP